MPLFERLAWSFATLHGSHGFRALLPFVITGLALYFGDYLVVFFIHLARRLRPERERVQRRLPPALLVIPSLVRSVRDAEGMIAAAESAMTNGYPGLLIVVLAIDDRTACPPAVFRLERWIERVHTPPNVELRIVATERRVGKAMAIERALEDARVRAERDGVRLPVLFFNMDADSALGPNALTRMGRKLVTRRPFFGTRPTIVASNVVVPRTHYANSVRRFFSLEGQIALSVAREYLGAITLAKHNLRLLPVTTASGALYCTWANIHFDAPRHARWLRTLRVRDFARWCIGWPLPRFVPSEHEPLPEALTGPGDDTYVSWLALSARFDTDTPTLAPPRTLWGALRVALVRSIERPLAYDPLAKIYTTSPTTVRALFVQRKRWNGSRSYTIARLLPTFFYAWDLGAAVAAELAIVLGLHVAVLGLVASLVLHPTDARGAATFFLVLFAGSVLRFITTALAIWVAREWRAWPTLFASLTAYPYHLVFNILTTVIVWWEDVLLFGTKTNFAPEATLIRSGTGRVALGYRLRRACTLALRALVHGDVPFGRFWFGWAATRYTNDGYAGWTEGATQILRVPQRKRSPTASQERPSG